MDTIRFSRRFVQGLFSVFCLAAIGLGSGCAKRERVVLYCAQDKEFAQDSLQKFTSDTGIIVSPKYDTEAAKSVSLYVELVADAKRPRCDVFWNNEILSTIRLQKKGMLDPYESPNAAPYPAQCRARDHTWHAFANRARVLIVNRDLVDDVKQIQSIFDLTDERWKGQIAMSSPLHGTSATQAACLFEVLGEKKARQFYKDLKENKVQVLDGNKQVAEAVGSGRVAIGITDTDDAFAELEAGRNVAIIFPDRDGHKDYPRLGTLFIPNTVCIMKGGPDPENARRLIDYLLSAEVEEGLAESASHQIPMNPKASRAKLPKEMETPETVKAMKVDFEKAADAWDEAQQFLVDQFAD
jgi:iron(III) transport system substrate-binding protein